MRTWLPIQIFPFIVIVAMPALAQQSDSLHTDTSADSLLSPLSMSELIGTSPIPIRALNNFLAENHMEGSEFPTDLFKGSNSIGVEEYLTFGSWRAGLGGQLARVTIPNMHYSYWSIQASAGYQLPLVGRLRLTPYAAIGARFNKLAISNDQQSHFAR